MLKIIENDEKHRDIFLRIVIELWVDFNDDEKNDKDMTILLSLINEINLICRLDDEYI